MMFLPEITIRTSKEFRMWIKEGIEDADGKLNKSDIKDGLILYVSLWSLRVFIGFSVSEVFYKEIDFKFYITPLIFSFGTAGLTIIKSIKKKML